MVAVVACALAVPTSTATAVTSTDETTSGRVVASAPVPGRNGIDSVVTADGRKLVVLSGNRLTQYALGERTIRPLGSTVVAPMRKGTDFQLAVHPGGRAAYVVWHRFSNDSPRDFGDVVRVYDLTVRAPRYARTVALRRLLPQQPDAAEVAAITVSPDGRRLVVLGGDGGGHERLLVLDVRRPGTPASGAVVNTEARPYLTSMSVTPDSSRLLINSDPRLYSYRLPRTAAPVLEASPSIEMPGGDWRGDPYLGTNIVGVTALGDGTAYIGMKGETDQDDWAEQVSTVMHVRVSDGAVLSHTDVRGPEEGWAPGALLGAVSNNGRRVYATWGWLNVETPRPRSLVWYDADLATRHDGPALGWVRDVVVSPGGPTRGLVYVVSLRSGGHLRVSAVDLR
ncbi:hypothetical protein GCM10009795_043060 [Nocardioides hankookensis]